MIWFNNYNLAEINEKNKNSMVSHCRIVLTECTEDSLTGEMQVSDNIKQPFGIVHGGANCVLSETLGSIAANMVCDPEVYHGVGQSITTNHIRAVRSGKIKGIAKPVHIGRTSHIWEIKTFND